MQNKAHVIIVTQKQKEKVGQKISNVYKMPQLLWKLSTYKFKNLGKSQRGETKRKLYLCKFKKSKK